MALQKEENHKGFDLPEAYHKIQNIHIDMVRYKDLVARGNDLIMDTYSVSIPVTSGIYDELKKLPQFQGSVDC